MEINIEKLIYGGKGIGKLYGKTCFVPFVIDGETVEVRVKKEKKNFIECELSSIIEPSPHRVKPLCKYFRYCGGCDYQHIKYEKQIEIKKEILKETLERLGKLENIDISKVIPSEKPFFYRNRVQFKVRGNQIGFYMKESNRIVNIDSCLILKEDLNESLEGLKELIEFLEFKPVEIHIYSTNLNQVLIKFIYPKRFKRFPLGLKHIKAFVNKNTVGIGIFEKNNEFLKKFISIGKQFVYEVINLEEINREIKYRVSINSFFQVNRFQVKNLVKEVLEEIKNENYKEALDLYCGVGTITLPIALYVNKVIGIEANKFAVEDGNHNKKLNSLKNVNFIKADAGKNIDILEKYNPDLVVLDPPRSGITKELLNYLNSKESIKKIVYVSCNPSTLARDLAVLSERFYIKNIKLIDMFPQTYHIESITTLEKKR
ncbi:MAG: 23S rRNA (uracil(1939)-C(5))-methyltransferase RlmD [Persephonella sp.]|nr:MAG: 23S rRNA (uracil(1939)-C(5))-methyltransferase RlmD [Persephonella sp.]